MEIEHIKREKNGWLIQGWDNAGSYVELFMDNNELVKAVVDYIKGKE